MDVPHQLVHLTGHAVDQITRRGKRLCNIAVWVFVVHVGIEFIISAEGRLEFVAHCWQLSL